MIDLYVSILKEVVKMLNLENEIVKLFKEDKKVGIKFLLTVKLSEEFFIEFAEKLNLDWFWISANQDLSD